MNNTQPAPQEVMSDGEGVTFTCPNCGAAISTGFWMLVDSDDVECSKCHRAYEVSIKFVLGSEVVPEQVP